MTAPDRLLRYALRANASFSIVSGLVFLVAAPPLAAWMGVPSPVYLVVIGIGVLLFAVDLLTNAARTELHLPRTLVVIIMDIAWVVGSAVLLWGIDVGLTDGGRWLVLGIADVVACFAIAQTIGYRRIRRVQQTALKPQTEG